MTVRGKRIFTFSIDSDTAEEFRGHIINKYGTIHALSVEFENIIRSFLKGRKKRFTPLAQEKNRIWQKLRSIVDRMEDEGFTSQILETDLIRIIKEKAGVDRRTVNNRIALMKDMKIITGEIVSPSGMRIYDLDLNPMNMKTRKMPEILIEHM